MMIGIHCMSFFVLSEVLARIRFKLGGDGRSLGKLGFMQLFLASSHDRSSLHKFLSPRSFRLHMAQTQWVGELRFMKLFFSEFLDGFLLGGGASCQDNSYLGEFLCFQR